MTFLKSAITSAALLAGGAVGMAPDNADAQVRFQIGIGSGGYGNGGYYRNPDFGYRNFGRSYSNYGGYGSRYDSFYGGSRYGNHGHRHGGWHDTSHYDYHPTTVVPHGNHYDVIPGHYDYHQSGHRH